MNLIILIHVFTTVFQLVLSQSCNVTEIFVIRRICGANDELTSADQPVYILYSVNPAEGFNLRRDVYLRMANFVKTLIKVQGYSNAQLVLPVFHHLYHWKSHFRQTNMFWNHFFDIDSLKRHTRVIDMWEFFDIVRKETGQDVIEISEVYVLQQFETMFESGVFVDKFEETACARTDLDNYHFLEYYNITEKTITCLNFQGSASLLIEVLEEYKAKQGSTRPNTQASRIVLFSVISLSLVRN